MTNDGPHPNAPGPGSDGNVLAAIASVFVPGLGQLVQGRMLRAGFFFCTATVLYALMITWPFAVVVHLWSIVDAATFRGR